MMCPMVNLAKRASEYFQREKKASDGSKIKENMIDYANLSKHFARVKHLKMRI